MNTAVAAAALILLAVSLHALMAADRAPDEPAIRPDPRPTDLTTGRRGSNDEPPIRDEPRARDLSIPKTAAGRSTIEVSSLTLEQSERLRAIRERAASEIEAIRDRERAEILAVLNEEQRAQYLKLENEQALQHPRRTVTTTSSPTTAPVEPLPPAQIEPLPPAPIEPLPPAPIVP